ncbi:ATPase AAA [Alteromonas marina]|jgi:MoxR-like ATPase|uniref:ATPase AAA n=1 Tax=Alteromonas marina TaxID=203795 RepID=A0A0B3YKE0_9ALTE|nr:MoxR family ATPase [Alteromonas marina]KHT57818.1 ATPase AAA [Alteromonas marina]|tara:strand:- start:179 stop:1126 length:948 start_codon:yes stop_codon:yes gene_type:complete
MRQDINQVQQALSKKIIGKEHQLKLAITCLLANGHLLIEDLPGMGKTTLSHALSQVFGLQYARIQFTSDLLPSDMLGINIFHTHERDEEKRFTFRHGPIFSQVVLADELNRASPKTQSALLEAMEERQVSIDGVTHALPTPFFVIATQNPSYQSGTYPLPESQLDRFFMRISLGYPAWEAEKAMLMQQDASAPLTQILDAASLNKMQNEVAAIHTSDAILHYILRLVSESRQSNEFPNPLSPRASRALLQGAKAWAYVSGKDYVTPEDVQAVFIAITAHRLTLSTHQMAHGQSNHAFDGEKLSQKLLDSIDPLAA